MNGRSGQTYPVLLVVVLVGAGSRDQARESGVGVEIVPRKIMSANDGNLTEVVRRKGPAKYSMLAANLQNLRNERLQASVAITNDQPFGRASAPK